MYAKLRNKGRLDKFGGLKVEFGLVYIYTNKVQRQKPLHPYSEYLPNQFLLDYYCCPTVLILFRAILNATQVVVEFG